MKMSEGAELRQRGTKSLVSEAEPSKDFKKIARTEDKGTRVILEAARTLLLLFVMSSALSYFVTREDIFWGLKRPAWTRPEVFKSWLVGFLPLHPKLSLLNN